MKAQRPALVERYVVHLPIDLGDATPRFVGTSTATGQSVMIAVVSKQWAQAEAQSVTVAHRHLATLIEAIDSPDVSSFPGGFELPADGTALIAELVRGVGLSEMLSGGPLIADRAVAWAIRILEGLSLLHRRGGCHGAISAAALVAEPKLRPIAPVVSRLVIPPLKQYASPERLSGSGPSAADDLWATGVLLCEMLLGKPPFPVGRGVGFPVVLAPDILAALHRLPHGPALETIVRRAFGVGTSRLSSAEEFLELLDAWERRVMMPPATSKLTRPQGGRREGAPAAWDLICDDFSAGTKRLDAILDAAEQMRQSVEPERPVGVTPPPKSSKWPELQQATTKGGAPAQGQGSKSVSPKSRRRHASIGPELAAFAARSRPTLKPWLIGVGAVFVVLLLAYNAWVWLAPKFAGTPSPVASEGFAQETTPSEKLPNQPAERPKLSARELTTQCITSYFRDGALVQGIDLGFVCTDEDFLSVNRRLHEESMNTIAALSAEGGAPQPSVSPSGVPLAPSGVPAATSSSAAPPAAASANRALVVRSGTTSLGWQLGWYELVATAIIRQTCCREAAPIKLPETTGWCQQMQNVVRRIATDSAKIGDISPAVRSFDETVSCLSAQGKHIAYPYKAVPTSLQKAAFQQFLKHAAEVDAKRSARR
jgi:hypothetical protein